MADLGRPANFFFQDEGSFAGCTGSLRRGGACESTVEVLLLLLLLVVTDGSVEGGEQTLIIRKNLKKSIVAESYRFS